MYAATGAASVMTLQIAEKERLLDGISRIGNEIIDITVDDLLNTPLGPNEAIHEARKSCKRLRALIRLVRGQVDEERYQQANFHFRDASRLMSPVRDSNVLVVTLDAVQKNFGVETGLRTFAGIRERLESHHQAQVEALLNEKKVNEIAAALLEDGRCYFDNFALDTDGFGAIRFGIRRAYRRGRSSLERIQRKGGEPEDFHEWRKRVKYLWHQVEFLTPIWPDAMGQNAVILHRLSDYLGDAHDLAVLANWLAENEIYEAHQKDVAVLIPLVLRWMKAFEGTAIPLGCRLFAEDADAFTIRMEQYYETWRRHGALTRGPSFDAVLTGEADGFVKDLDLLSTREAALLMDMPVAALRRAIRQGQMPAKRVGDTWVLHASDLSQ